MAEKPKISPEVQAQLDALAADSARRLNDIADQTKRKIDAAKSTGAPRVDAVTPATSNPEPNTSLQTAAEGVPDMPALPADSTAANVDQNTVLPTEQTPRTVRRRKVKDPKPSIGGRDRNSKGASPTPSTAGNTGASVSPVADAPASTTPDTLAPVADAKVPAPASSISTPDTTPTVQGVDASQTPDLVASSEKWTLDRLLTEIPEGQKFILKSPRGEDSSFYRKDNHFYSQSGGDVVQDKNILDRLRGRWTLEMAEPQLVDFLKGRDPKKYNELFEGDEWVQYGPTGEELRRIKLIELSFLKYTSTNFVFVSDSANQMKADDFGEDLYDVMKNHDGKDVGIYKDLEAVRLMLQQEGFVLAVAGGRSEKERMTPAIKMEQSESNQIKEQPNRDKNVITDDESKIIREARAVVKEEIQELVRLEDQQKEKTSWVKKVLGLRLGDLNNEIETQRQKVDFAIATLQNIQIEDAKNQKNIQGETFQQRIAAIIGEGRLNVEEMLDEARWDRKLSRLSLPIKEKWQALKEDLNMMAEKNEGIKGWQSIAGFLRWSAGGAVGTAQIAAEQAGKATYGLGRAYNKLTKTRTGKIATLSAGVAGGTVLFFASGGAAAGVAATVLAAKRAAASAGVAVMTEELTTKGAQWYRKRKVEKEAEEWTADISASTGREVASEFSHDRNLASTPITVEEMEKIKQERILVVLEKKLEEMNAVRWSMDKKRRNWAKIRKLLAVTAGVTLGKGALDLIETGAGSFADWKTILGGEKGGTGVDRVAEKITKVADAASTPVTAASAADQSVSAPTASVAGVTPTPASSAVRGLPTVGGLDLPVEGEGSSSALTELPNALNQSKEFYQSGLVPDAAKLDGLMGEKVIARGDTLWKYALEGGQAAGLGEAEQSRFAALLRDKLTEKLSMVDPDAAKAAGFAPNKAGIFTPNFIRIGDTLHLDKLLTTSEMQQLLEQAQQPSAAGGVADAVTSGKPDIFNTNYTSLKEATRDALKVYGEVPDLENKQYTQLTDAAKDYVRVHGTVPNTDVTIPGAPTVDSASPVVGNEMATPSQDVLTKLIESKEWGKGEKFNIALSDYLSSLPRFDQVNVFREIRGTVRDLFQTPEISIYNNYDANYDFSLHPELAKASVARVLADHAALADKFYITYDRAANPLHWTQMQQVAQFADHAAKALGGEIAKPLTGEGIDEYTRRMAILAHAKGITFPGLRVIQ